MLIGFPRFGPFGFDTSITLEGSHAANPGLTLIIGSSGDKRLAIKREMVNGGWYTLRRVVSLTIWSAGKPPSLK